MDQEKNWMLITYYCPTHGDSGLVKPIQITKKEIFQLLRFGLKVGVIWILLAKKG